SKNGTGVQACEYLPNIAKRADKLAIIRGMSTSDPDHSGGTYLMHTGYRREGSVRHPEVGAMVAKYLGNPMANLPSFVQLGLGGGESSPNVGAGFLGPAYQPFRLSYDGRMPQFSTPIVPGDSEARRGALLAAVESDFLKDRKAEAFDAYRLARGQKERLMKARGVFDVSKEWAKAKDRYGDTPFGKNCLLARKLIESGVLFVEVGQSNYDSHADNFDWHKALLPVLDQAWSALLDDLSERGLLK